MKETLLKTLYYACTIIAAFDTGAAIAQGKFPLAICMAVVTIVWIYLLNDNENE